MPPGAGSVQAGTAVPITIRMRTMPSRWKTRLAGGLCPLHGPQDRQRHEELDQWPREYRKREPQALEAFKAENEEEIGFWKFLQYEFSIQWKKLKAYANANNVQILGDIPSMSRQIPWMPGWAARCLSWMQTAALPGWQAARRITSRQTASSGATRCTTGPTISRPAMPGGSSVSAMPGHL